MNVYSDTQLHRDHCRWTEERAMWYDDIRVWEKEVEAAEARLKRVASALAQQKHDLQVHAGVIRAYQERDGRRERLLAEFERDGNEERGLVLIHAHEGDVQQHERQRERHEEIKTGQHRLISELHSLNAIADHLPPTVRQ